MGARAGYTWLTGIFVGVGGMLGFLSNLIEFIPLAVLAPVLVFLALNITVQAFTTVPLRHAPAVAISFFPSIARLVSIELSDPRFIAPERFARLLTSSEHGLPALAVIVALGNGFIITATLWAAFVVEMTEHRLRAAAAYLLAGAVLCFFGGFLGMGDRLFAVPWRALTLDTEKHRFTLNVNKDDLKNAPGFDKDHWPSMADPSWASGVNRFYGTTYHN